MPEKNPIVNAVVDPANNISAEDFANLKKQVAELLDQNTTLIAENATAKLAAEELKLQAQIKDYNNKIDGWKNLSVDNEDNKFAKAMIDVANKCPEAFAMIEATLEAANNIKESSTVFNTKGSDKGKEVNTNAYEDAISKANDLIAVSNGQLTLPQALKEVFKADNKLYSNYLKQIGSQAATVYEDNDESLDD